MRLGVAILVGLAVILAMGCETAAPMVGTPSTSPTPLQTPNGGPPEKVKTASIVFPYVLFENRAYSRQDTLAHVRVTTVSQPDPMFLKPVGDVVMATLNSGQYIPAPGPVDAAFSVADTSTDQAIVVRFTLQGTNRYWVYIRYLRV